MITQADGTVLYTAEERTELINKFDERITSLQGEVWKGSMEIAKLQSLNSECRDTIVRVMRDEAREGTMDRDDATELCNKILSALGLRTVNSVQTLWGVSVTYYDQVVAEFSDIEADDEDDAIEQVRSDMEVDSSDVQFQISFNGEICEESAQIEVSTYDFEFQAAEQD